MHCPSQSDHGTEMILDYLGGRLGRAAASRMERHFEECAACQEAVRSQQAVWEVLDDWKPEPVSADFDNRLYQRIEAEGGRRGWWNALWAPVLPFSLRPVLAVAAVCLILAAGFLLRTPDEAVLNTVSTAEPVDIDEIERAVEDLDMLYLMGPAQYEEDAAEPGPEEEANGVVSVWLGRKRCV